MAKHDPETFKNLMEIYEPVSYTHLDVYKRQGEGMDAWCEWLKCYVAQYLGENQNG